MQGHQALTDQAIRSRLERPVNAPTADRLATSRQIRSMPSPSSDLPPRVPFNWWCAPETQAQATRRRLRGAHTAIIAINKAIKNNASLSIFKYRNEHYKRNPATRLPFDWWGVGNLETTGITKHQRKAHPVVKFIDKAVKYKRKAANDRLHRQQELARQQARAQQNHRIAGRRTQHQRQDEAETRALISRFADELPQSSQHRSALQANAAARQKRDEQRQAIIARSRPLGRNLTKSKYFA